MKYSKFGHTTATDYASRMIHYGFITREEVFELVKRHDHNLDPKSVEDFIELAGYTVSEFWDIVDNYYNEEIFKLNEFGEWKLKKPIWEQ